MLRHLATWVLAGVTLSGLAARGDDIVGWRGNWTGLWPDAQTPVEWSRLPMGATRGLQCATTRPADESAAPQGTTAVRDGLIRDWLVIGPFPVTDSVKQFEESQIANEAELKPAAGDKVGRFGVENRFQCRLKTAGSSAPASWHGSILARRWMPSPIR